jgi:hypothetical protein
MCSKSSGWALVARLLAFLQRRFCAATRTAIRQALTPELLRLASLEVWSGRLPWPTGYGFPIERDPALYVRADGPTVVLTLRGGTAVRHYFASRPDTTEFFVRLADQAAYNCRAPVHYVGF